LLSWWTDSAIVLIWEILPENAGEIVIPSHEGSW
jgi:hypothetical protein